MGEMDVRIERKVFYLYQDGVDYILVIKNHPQILAQQTFLSHAHYPPNVGQREFYSFWLLRDLEWQKLQPDKTSLDSGKRNVGKPQSGS